MKEIKILFNFKKYIHVTYKNVIHDNYLTRISEDDNRIPLLNIDEPKSTNSTTPVNVVLGF